MTTDGNAPAMNDQSTDIHVERKDKCSSMRCLSALYSRFATRDSFKRSSDREMKRALVQTRVANHFAAHARAQDGFEHVLLEPTNDRVALQQIQDRGMTLNNAGATILFVDELRHVTFPVTNMRE